MATQALNAYRRSLLAAGIATVVAVSAAAVATATRPARTQFNAAEQAYIAADKAMNDFGNGELDRAHEAWMAWQKQWPSPPPSGDAQYEAGFKQASAAYDPVEARYDELFEVRNAAMKELLRTGSPDTNAVARKLEILIGEDAWDCTYWEEMIGHVMADLRRLGSAA